MKPNPDSDGIMLAVGRWPLAVGRWPLAVGRWPLAMSAPGTVPGRCSRCARPDASRAHGLSPASSTLRTFEHAAVHPGCAAGSASSSTGSIAGRHSKNFVVGIVDASTHEALEEYSCTHCDPALFATGGSPWPDANADGRFPPDLDRFGDLNASNRHEFGVTVTGCEAPGAPSAASL